MSWFLSEEEDPIQSRPVDDTLQRTLHLVQEHEKTLRILERGFGDNTESLTDEYYQPVSIDLAPQERVLPLELINTGKEEKFFKKVLAVFGYLCDEINELKDIAQTTFYPKVILFGYPQSGKNEDNTPLPGQAEEQMGRMLTFMQELSNFVDRCHISATNLIQQLAKLYNGKEKLFQSTFQFVHLSPVYDSLSDLLGILVTLDCAIQQNQHISPAWNDYKRMMQFVRDKPESYDVNNEKVVKFEKLLVQLDQSVMRGTTFKACIEMDFEELLPVDDDDEIEEINIRNNSQFLSELFHCLKNKIERSEAIIGTHAETNERINMVGYVALYVLYRRLTPAFVEPDAKFYRRLWNVQRKIPIVILAGKLIWTLPEFLEEHARLESVKKLEPSEPMLARRQYLESLDNNFNSIIQRIHLEVISWTINMENSFQSSSRNCGDPIPLLETRGSLLLRGLINANKISTMMKTLVNLHLSLGVPMQRKVLRPLCMCVELLKSLEFVAVKKASVISESMAHISRILSARMLKVTRPIRTKLQASRKFDDHKMDVLAAVNVIETLLHGSDSFTFSRQSVLGLSLCVCLNPNIVKESEQEGTMALFKRIQLLADWQPQFKSACNCSFLLWNKELLPTFISDIFKCPTEANRLQYICAGFSDASILLRKVQHEEDNQLHLINYKSYVIKCIEDGLVKPLCVGVEEDLRLRIHAKNHQGTIAQETFNPKKRSPKPLKSFIDLKPLRVLGSVLDIRQKVTHYLETMFYNLTTMALYDWMTYADMRNLAAEKFGIEMADNHLPMGSLEYDQGLDVLMIMRNIHIFVGRFSYNLNQQNFVERRPDRGSKNLNTINIQSIAASLRQHGLGILNTTVNFTYQFLAQKFHVFSQFLFDEYIKGHLGKERRWYKKHKTECNNMYPYDRGLKFVKDIRKLGVLENGRTFLDQFRILITEIGNALGYVRMVRSAGMLFCSEAVRFLPDIDSLINFEAHAGSGSEPPTENEGEGEDGEVKDNAVPIIGANLSEGTIKAAKNLDDVTGTLASNFSEGNDYFKVLVSVFQQVLLSGDHSHLDNFHMVIPSLCLSWVDASYQAKMYMYKSNRARDTYYTDDGFAVGLAYILAILKQGHKFDSMHWFQSMRVKIDNDTKAINDKKEEANAKKKASMLAAKKAAAASRSMFSMKSSSSMKEVKTEVTEEEEEAVHTLQQSDNKLQATKRENDLLFFSLSGARVFFKR